MYKDKYGITSIINKDFYNLSINWDNFVNSSENFSKPKYKKNRIPVLLFTPDMQNTNEHYHITLTKNEAKKLKTWLSEYLKDCRKK
jgi:hypothetical protein